MCILLQTEKWLCTFFVALLMTRIVMVFAIEITDKVNKAEELQLTTTTKLPSDPSAIWGYICIAQHCKKTVINVENKDVVIGLSRCRQTCGQPQPMDFWPKPRTNIGKILTPSDPNNTDWTELDETQIRFIDITNNGNLSKFWLEIEQRFHGQLVRKLPSSKIDTRTIKYPCNIYLWSDSGDERLHMDVDESYQINGKFVENSSRFYINIKAKSIFGVRHAIETIIQIIIYDDISQQLLIRRSFEINDEPAYSHRGITLDTARNFYSVDAIKRTIDAMAMVKLNVFHWHMTDTQSFPLALKTHPYLAKYGAYAIDKIYTADNVSEIVNYAYYRGVRVLPELDAPAHLGEGWQFTDLLTCFDRIWTVFCAEPPCGQVDPTKPELYDVLEDIYREMMTMFRYPDAFHMGGDEVSLLCWNDTATIGEWMRERGWGVQKKDFMKLWNYFQTEALRRLDKIDGGGRKIFLWTSGLTELPYLTQYLNKERYIIQIWTNGYDPIVMDILKSGFKVIISNYDSLYLDCGYESWTSLGNNWCSPYSGWHKIYTNYMYWGPEYVDQILGGEAALWSEQADEQSLDGRLWPRGIALAEWLWSAPLTSFRLAEPRILMQRERFVENGIRAEALQPEWCLLNEGKCPI